MVRRLLVPCLVALAALSAAAASPASTIVYQCTGRIVCAVDPDTTAAPRQLTTDGRIAGITRDGTTAAWVGQFPVRIDEVPLAGGAARTLYTGEVGLFPSLSPSGARALWDVAIPPGFYTYASTGPTTASSIASSTYQTSHGWLGETPLVVRRGHDGSTSKICDAAANGAACTDAQAVALEADTSSQIAFPDGSPDRSTIVAIRAPAPSTYGIPVAGTVALYSTTTHQRLRDLTPGATGGHAPGLLGRRHARGLRASGRDLGRRRHRWRAAARRDGQHAVSGAARGPRPAAATPVVPVRATPVVRVLLLVPACPAPRLAPGPVPPRALRPAGRPPRPRWRSSDARGSATCDAAGCACASRPGPPAACR